MGSLRPTSSKILINFSNSTHVEKLVTDDFMIPMNKFEFTDLGDLFSVVSGYENADSPPLATGLSKISRTSMLQLYIYFELFYYELHELHIVSLLIGDTIHIPNDFLRYDWSS